MKTMLARRVISALLVVGLIAVLAGPGHAQFVDYDDFASGAIDPEKWQGTSTEGSAAAPTGRALRIVEGDALRIALTSWGGDSSNSGFVTTRERVRVRQLGTPGGSGSITGLKAHVTPLALDVQDCAANPDTGANGTSALRARARLVAWFFNDGNGAAGNQTGDIFGQFQLVRQADGANGIRADVIRCSNATCSVTASAVGGEQVFAATWTLGSPLVYEIAWDQASSKITYTVTNPSTLAVESHDLVYLGTVASAGPPIGNFTALEVLNSVKSCSGARKRVLTDALFDNVQVRRQP
jgi:hypothetical protein